MQYHASRLFVWVLVVLLAISSVCNLCDPDNTSKQTGASLTMHFKQFRGQYVCVPWYHLWFSGWWPGLCEHCLWSTRGLRVNDTIKNFAKKKRARVSTWLLALSPKVLHKQCPSRLVFIPIMTQNSQIHDIFTENRAAHLSLNLASQSFCSWKSNEYCYPIRT